MNYTKQLEVENEELRQMLAVAQTKLNEIENKSAFYRLSKDLDGDEDYAWTFHCNIVSCIEQVDTRSNHVKSNKLAEQIMRHFFGCTKYLAQYKDWE